MTTFTENTSAGFISSTIPLGQFQGGSSIPPGGWRGGSSIPPGGWR